MNKQKHSDFYYKLQNLNDKIDVFKKMFYNNKAFYQKYYQKSPKQMREFHMYKKRKAAIELVKTILNQQKRKSATGTKPRPSVLRNMPRTSFMVTSPKSSTTS